MTSEDNVHDEILHKSVHKTVDARIEQLCPNVFGLDDLSLCSFANYVGDETNINITTSQHTENVTEVGISAQMKEKRRASSQ